MRIAKGTLPYHHVCVKGDSKYVTNDVKCYNSGSLLHRCQHSYTSKTHSTPPLSSTVGNIVGMYVAKDIFPKINSKYTADKLK
jgi:hypothetical protein